MKAKIIVTDHYLSFHHGLYNGTFLEVIPIYTSTKILKCYKVKSKKTGVDIYLDVNEIEI